VSSSTDKVLWSPDGWSQAERGSLGREDIKAMVDKPQGDAQCTERDYIIDYDDDDAEYEEHTDADAEHTDADEHAAGATAAAVGATAAAVGATAAAVGATAAAVGATATAIMFH